MWAAMATAATAAAIGGSSGSANQQRAHISRRKTRQTGRPNKNIEIALAYNTYRNENEKVRHYAAMCYDMVSHVILIDWAWGVSVCAARARPTPIDSLFIRTIELARISALAARCFFFAFSSLLFFANQYSLIFWSDRLMIAGLLWLLLVHISFIWFSCCCRYFFRFFFSLLFKFWPLVWFLTRLLFLWLSALFSTTSISLIFLSGAFGGVSRTKTSVSAYTMCVCDFFSPFFIIIIIYFLFCCHHCVAILREMKTTKKTHTHFFCFDVGVCVFFSRPDEPWNSRAHT